MSKGNANDTKTDFVAKVRYEYQDNNKVTHVEYRPIYTAPDATSNKRGEVWLSDAVNSQSNAVTGAIAATPKAVYDVNETTKRKLDKQQSEAQTVQSPLTFANTLTVQGNITGNNGFTGHLIGNADSATKLQKSQQFSVKVGNNGTAATANFDGTTGVNLSISSINAADVNTGMLPLTVIPQTALDHLEKVQNKDARFALTTSNVQTGDSVLQLDTGIMYIVVDDTKLNSEAGYQEYKAGTAAKAAQADKATTADSATTATTANKLNHTLSIKYSSRQHTQTSLTTLTETWDGSSDKDISIPNIIYYSNMTGATSSADGKNGLVPAPTKSDVSKFLRGDGTWAVVQSGVTGVKGNSESSYRMGNVNLTAENIGALSLGGGTLTGSLSSRTIVPTANNQYNLGSSALKYSNIYAATINATTINGTVSKASAADTATTASKLNKTLSLSGDVTGSASLSVDSSTPSLSATIAASAVTTTKIKDANVTTSKIADANITEAKLAANAVTSAKIKDANVTTAKIADSNVTSAKIASKAITNSKLADDVGTVYVGSTEPTEEHVKIWIKY